VAPLLSRFDGLLENTVTSKTRGQIASRSVRRHNDQLSETPDTNPRRSRYFVVLSFVRGENGDLVPERPVERQSAQSAKRQPLTPLLETVSQTVDHLPRGFSGSRPGCRRMSAGSHIECKVPRRFQERQAPTKRKPDLHDRPIPEAFVGLRQAIQRGSM
jgi:hypothetical protein